MTEAVLAVRDGLEREIYQRRSDVASAVGRLLTALGWDVFDPRQVSRNYPTGNQRLDFALFPTADRPLVVIDTRKGTGPRVGGATILLEFCRGQDIPLAVLTNARRWLLYSASGSAGNGDGCFLQLDLLDEAPPDVAQHLTRHLARSQVESGRAQAAAEAALEEIRGQSRAARSFEPVLRTMVEGPDDSLVDLFCARVEETSGARPARDAASVFLARTLDVTTSSSRSQTETRSAKSAPPSSDGSRSPELTMFGRTSHPSSGKDLLVDVFAELARRDEGFCHRFASAHRGRTRRYLARARARLYPGNPEFARKFAEELPGGWWIATQNSNRGKRQLIQKACAVAGVGFGTDVIVRLPTIRRSAGSRSSRGSKVATPPASGGGGVAPKSPQPGQIRPTGTGRFVLTLEGSVRRFPSGVAALVAAFEWFASRDAGFLERFAREVRGTSVHYVARDRMRMYLSRPKAGPKNSAALSRGWWIATQNSSAQKKSLIRRACELAGLKWGQDVLVDFPAHHRYRKKKGPTAKHSSNESAEAILEALRSRRSVR